MQRTSGRPEVKIGLIDGPVDTQHPNLEIKHLRGILSNAGTTCTMAGTAACLHGTFVAGILSAKRNSPAPAICPNCSILVRPIFPEVPLGSEQMTRATPQELATAIIDCIEEGAHVINLSLALIQPSIKGEQALEEALNQAVRRGVIMIVAAGNQGTVTGSPILRHPWVIPVVACDRQGRPMKESNVGSSIGRRGLSAPGDAVTSLGAGSQSLTFGGTSVAVPFVTGATALLLSEFPTASAVHIKLALTQASALRRISVVPPLLDAEAAYNILLTANTKR